MISLNNFFEIFRNNTIGDPHIVYADWTASGRAYRPIEEYLQKEVLPFVGNTHSHTTITGTLMSDAYAKSKAIVKQHVHAGSEDVLIFCGSGMTGAVNKLQRIMGLRMPERMMDYLEEDSLEINEILRPVVFITHMEHHSNQLSWIETIASVEIFSGLDQLAVLLQQYRHRKNKIAAVTACSNVTGIETAYHEIAKMMHAADGVCFVDFACSAPYVNINMHPEEEGAHLDAIYFSAHKFLGGPGTPGVLIFHQSMYTNKVPDQPGGGTVLYSNPWKEHEYVNDIEEREDAGTPPFLQAIKVAMCIRLKEAMGVENILKREKELLQVVFERFAAIKNIEVLEGDVKKRLGVISFIVQGAHYNLMVKMLNDRFGIQVRGGCSCAGTYGHHLLQVDKKTSYDILNRIRSGDMLSKPGWVRLSLHPTMSNAEVNSIMDAIENTVLNFKDWKEDYVYDNQRNEFVYKDKRGAELSRVDDWFNISSW